jgi:hypothetical protein
MANRRLPVRKLKEVLRLKYACGLSNRELAQRCEVGRTTVTDYLNRAKASGLTWAAAEDGNMITRGSQTITWDVENRVTVVTGGVSRL